MVSIRFRNTELASVVARYQVDKVSAKEDASVRFKCLVEAVVNAAKCAYHTLAESYAGARVFEKGSKWSVEKAKHRTAADEAEKKCKIYFVSISDPKKGLPKLVTSARSTAESTIIDAASKGVHAAEKVRNRFSKWFN